MNPRNYVISPHTFVAAEHCPTARVFRGPKQPPSHAMWHGIAIHRFIEYAMNHDRDYALDYIKRKFPRRLDFCKALDLSSIPLGTLEPQYIIDTKGEFAVLLDPGTVRAEASAKEHIMVRGDLLVDQSVPQREVSWPWIIDFKTGDRDYPLDSPQAMLEALCVWLTAGRPDRVRTSIFKIRKKETTPYHKDWTGDELEVAMKRARRVHLSVLETRAEFYQEEVTPDFVPGDHCYRCDVRLTCPHAPNADQ